MFLSAYHFDGDPAALVAAYDGMRAASRRRARAARLA